MTLISGELESSTQRTYRYLRLGIGMCVVIIAVAVGVATVTALGGTPLTSISAYYYTGAQGAFTGALVAVAVGVIALSGRGRDRAVLDAAALFAPLIALIPTPIAAGTIGELVLTCPGTDPCVPETFHGAVQTGVLTYVVVGLIALVVGGVVARVQERFRASLPSLLLALVVVFAVGVLWFCFREVLYAAGHLVSAGIFFLLIAAVAFFNFRPKRGEDERGPLVQRLYLGIAIGMAATVVILLLGVGAEKIGLWHSGHFVLIFEFLALGFFLAFWVLQSARNWNDSNPSEIVQERPVGG